MATHASILTWKIPQTEDPGGLQSMGSQSPTQLSNKIARTCPKSGILILSLTQKQVYLTSSQTSYQNICNFPHLLALS